ncbi:YgiW/YdeI family stress tolerance OB fold protein [Veronia pacifica]|uniref:Uncharacterized protein n=1 Tax=Veronia pacifica TaxID=1080227 RepID=A0A1C3EST8_9GAMM|nr:NirD/YgiW/YdeI family stress tolerance protein [Veronia pacifica]ODA36269.1 hypothetical protein A8L45_01325 [Veronia pacifica]
MKIAFTLTCLAMFTSSLAVAEHHGSKGGFKGPSAAKVLQTVASARDAVDDTNVELVGNIVSSLGGDDYLFRDQTGEIEVDIDHRLWNGVEATPETKLILRGEVDRDWRRISVDVDRISYAEK